MLFRVLVAALLAGPILAYSHSGTPYGFATGVTGGGNARAAAPANIAELTEWLADNTPRVILIDKTFDFTGRTARQAGCYQRGCSPSQGGQMYLGKLSCHPSTDISVNAITYDTAGLENLKVASDKTILGVGNAGVLKGKGLVLPATTKNVIIQNIHITDINPGSVWGGDGIQLQGNAGVWIDHCKFSLIGRMFIVSDYSGTSITVSNTEFDGVTSTSATCNRQQYWGAMFVANGDRVTLDRNYWHDMSGRSPKLGKSGVTTTVQVLNNYFYHNFGHDFDIYPGTTALIEGNVFVSVTTPMTRTSESVSTIYNVPDASAASACRTSLGRACVMNSLRGSGEWPSMRGSEVLRTFSEDRRSLVVPVDVGQVASLVASGAGIGRI